MNTLHHFIKKDGLVIVSTPNNECLDDSFCICPKCRYSFHRWQHIRSFNDESLCNLFAAHGFQKEALHKVDFSDNASMITRLNTSQRELEWYKEMYGHGFLKRVLFSLFPKALPNISGSETVGEELRIGAESHLIYIGKK